MEATMRAVITTVLSGFPLTFLVLGLAVALAAIARLPPPRSAAAIVEKLISWHVFFSIGVSFFYNFVCHTFFGEMAARFIGWADSPFQLEVGMASLGFSAVGFVAAFSRSFDLRLAAILGPALFVLGAAVGHVHQMIVARNFAPGNAGIVFWMDIVLPLVGFVLLWLQKRVAGSRRRDVA